MSSMLSPGSLQPPKTGTSRWSKALPEVPGIDLDDIYSEYQDDPEPQDKDLPRLPIAPPPRTTSKSHAKPWKPTLSSLPPIDTSVGAPPTAPPMSIPRRPVGTQPSHVIQPPAEQHSPSASLSDILSAYSQPESPVLPFSIAAGQSQAMTSPSRQAPHANSRMGMVIPPSSDLRSTNQLAQTQQQNVAPNPPIKDDIPPPVPSKDVKRRLRTSSSASNSPISASDPNSASPTRSQLWRRRSVKTERALDLPDLKLVNSHGSTAASASAPAPQPAVQPVAQPMVQPVTQSTQPYLPPGVIKVSSLTYQQPKGNNFNTTSSNNAQSAPAPVLSPILDPAPVPVPDRTAFADSPTMGSGGSKLDRLKEKLSPLHRHGRPSTDASSDSTHRPGAHRPPTPEYQKQDVKTPIIDAFVSPLSPASSPEPVAEVSPEVPKDLPQLPQQDNSKYENAHIPARTVSLHNQSVESKPIVRKAVPPLPNQAPNELKPLPEPKTTLEPSQAKSELKPLPEQKLEVIDDAEPAEDLLSPLPGDIGSQPSPGVDLMGTLAQHSSEAATKFPPRGSSVRSNASRAAEHVRHPPAEQDPRLVPSESQGYLYRGRDGTLYPEMKVTQDPNPHAAYFPKQVEEVVPEHTIFKAVPLKESHFECFQGHRTMNRRSNRNYPLTCQSCEKPDAEDRWVCTFCHVRICELCFTTLNEHQKDLRQLVKILNQQVSQYQKEMRFEIQT